MRPRQGNCLSKTQAPSFVYGICMKECLENKKLFQKTTNRLKLILIKLPNILRASKLKKITTLINRLEKFKKILIVLIDLSRSVRIKLKAQIKIPEKIISNKNIHKLLRAYPKIEKS